MTLLHWTDFGAISAGGTVIAGVAEAQGDLLIATSAGLFRQRGESWSPLAHQPSLPLLHSFACLDDSIFVGGAEQIAFSRDGGKTWNRGQTTALEQPVTCLAISPNFAADRVVLAGTDGAGILRTTDGGKYWQHSGFGLEDFSISALVTAPCWDEREIAFAATASGLYRSPNGGRAWKRIGGALDGCPTASIAVSPNFADDGLALVGTEADGIYRSTDDGRTWQSCWTDEAASSVNALFFSADGRICLAGLDDGRALRSVDGGESWTPCLTASDAILCFFERGGRLFCGLLDGGLLHSGDAGLTWQPDMKLSARQFTRFLSGAGGALFAFGALEGLWQSDDGGQSWETAASPDALLLTAAAVDDDARSRLLATAEGVMRADAADPEGALVLARPDVTTICASPAGTKNRRIWLGTWSGDLFASGDGGREWRAIPAPPVHLPVVQIGTFLDGDQAARFVVVTFSTRNQMLTLWRLTNDGWQVWLESPADSPSAQIVELPGRSGELAVSLGAKVWLWSSGAWHCVFNADKPVLRLLVHPALGLIALTPDSLAHAPDFASWSVLNPPADGALNDLALAADSGLLLLTRGGGLVRASLD